MKIKCKESEGMERDQFEKFFKNKNENVKKVKEIDQQSPPPSWWMEKGKPLQKLKKKESESKEGNQLVELFKNEESERKGKKAPSNLITFAKKR